MGLLSYEVQTDNTSTCWATTSFKNSMFSNNYNIDDDDSPEDDVSDYQ